MSIDFTVTDPTPIPTAKLMINPNNDDIYLVDSEGVSGKGTIVASSDASKVGNQATLDTSALDDWGGSVLLQTAE